MSSNLECTDSAEQYDVAILGGGMAGLTLALQLKQERPSIKLLVIEKQRYPLVEAAHKVGESTVEIAARYLENLGLKEHLHTGQLRKFGLRFFFSSEDNQDIAQRVELGLSRPHSTPSYQLDRGRFENMLANEVERRGISFLSESKVSQVALEENTAHTIHIRQQSNTLVVQARWVVDASGRSALLKRQLGLAAKGPHRANAVWFRIARKIDINDWSNNLQWQARIIEGERYLSTNHLCGTGYWVWLIPLASGSTSVGIVTDPTFHAFETMNSFDRALAWLRQHEPQCASVIESCQAEIQDFRLMKDYSYSCLQVYSGNRWCLTGEAGAFIDPLYSPGSDFIAISNGLISDLILRDLNGANILGRARAYNLIYLNLLASWFTTYTQRYALLGNAQVMVAKYIWDTAIYWGGVTLLAFHDKIRRLVDSPALATNMQRLSSIGKRIQIFFDEWAALDQRIITNAFADHYNGLDFMQQFHLKMAATFTDAEFEAAFAANIGWLERVAGLMVSHVMEAYTTSSDEATLLQVQRWQSDPLLSECVERYKKESETVPINGYWLDLAKQNQPKVVGVG